MIFKATDIEDKLHRLRAKEKDGQHILDAVQNILQKDAVQKQKIANTLTSNSSTTSNAFNFDLLETDNIFHINQIKTICIDYRLRFLDSKYFKGQIPEEALSKIKALEKDHAIELQGFKIIAPSKLFKLEDKNDPLLFAPIGNDYFYLIHKWGTDLHPFRKLMVWPFKNIVNLIVLVLLISYVCTALIPDGLFSKSSTGSEKAILFFFMFKCVASMVVYYGFAMGKNFNPAIWKSKYFNS